MKTLLLLVAVFSSSLVRAIPPDQKTLPIGLAPFERMVTVRDAPLSEPPTGHIRSLGEWEDADAVMTLWDNPSLIRALTEHGNVRLLADDDAARDWWASWLANHGIEADRVDYFIVPTDSIWVRDYGPWFILDGAGTFGIVDTKYNRPRPQDDAMPAWLARELNLPHYQPGLVHTGGNYYNDGQDNAFSSTLVFTENGALSTMEVLERMKAFLGIERYVTSRLSPKVTIEHLDTFGKLVAPDTWVFSDFPAGSRHRADSEAYVAKLRTLKSPYGTPYKVHRLKMTARPGSGSEDFRAYLNSFISNRTLYFPTYGDEVDDETKAVYQAALPGYDIVGVDNGNTAWGDSVHCRNRNLLKKNTTFVFPRVEGNVVTAEVIPAPGRRITSVSVCEAARDCQPMEALDARNYRWAPSLANGRKVSFHIEASDDLGAVKTSPATAPAMRIEFTAQ